MVKQTWYGDANLTGTLDGADFEWFLSGYNGAADAEWLNGDFDYSGAIDAVDFELLVHGLAKQGRGVSGELFDALSSFVATEGLNVNLTAVPEPSFGVAGVVALMTTRRRRRSQ
jgi:hypothetical protein